MSRLRLSLVSSVVFLTLVSSPAARSQSVDALLQSKELASAYNPVVLDYLLAEGKTALPDAKRKEAIDQLVTALKKDIVITPEEQKAAALATAGAALGELFGGKTTSELGAAADDAAYQIWSGWIDSAITLDKAGYRDDAIAFFEKCIEIYPYSDLKGRCAIALAAAKPDESLSRLMALTNDSDPAVVGRSLVILGQLAGSDGVPARQRADVVKRITSFTSGLQKATYGDWACHGLVGTRDPAVVPTLQALSKGMMNTKFYPCSRRGLLLIFNDKSVVPLLQKSLQGGMMSTATPADKLSAAALLIDAGEDAGYAWASQQLTAKKASVARKFMQTSDESFDFKPSAVSLLAAGNKAKSLPVLTEGFDAAGPGSWLQTWIAVAMLELGDRSHLDLVKHSLSVPEWDFTAVRAATALERNGDTSGIAALGPVYDRAVAGTESSPGAEFLALLSGSGSEWSSDRNVKIARLIRLRKKIALALGESNRAEAVPLLVRMLSDSAASVRVSAANALTSMTEKSAAAGLAKAFAIDYGNAGSGASRNPVVHAAVVRAAGKSFRGEPATKGLLASAAKSPHASVKFLALTLEKPKAEKPKSKR